MDDEGLFDVVAVADGGLMLKCKYCSSGLFIMDHNNRFLQAEHQIERFIKDHKWAIRSEAAYYRELKGARYVPTHPVQDSPASKEVVAVQVRSR